MNSLTQLRVDLTLLALREQQLRGNGPAPGTVTPEYMAELSQELGHPVSHQTFRRIESQGLARLKRAISNTQPKAS